MEAINTKNFWAIKKFNGLHTSTLEVYTKVSSNCSCLTPIFKKLEKNKPIDWSPEHSTAFKKLLKLLAKITQNKHFDQHLGTRIVSNQTTIGPGG